MLLLSVSEFRANVSKYLQMAMTEKVAIRSKSGIFNITPNTEIRTTNPSPSKDAWFDVPENMEHLQKSLEKAHEKDASRYSWEEIKEDLSSRK
ncbi:MAG: hypothetical protein R3Y26_01175 [Rikenellaceae bacterium]